MPVRGTWTKPEMWAKKNPMTYKCKVLHLCQGNPRHEYRLGEEVMESNPEEKDFEFLVDMRQQCMLAAQKADNILDCIKRGHQVEGDNCSPLLCSLETPPGVPHPTVGSSVLKRLGPVGAGPEKGHKDDQGAGAPLL
ncbi:rna-directed dna polymerase from mobile element jockey-like [Pitangus sulphuratus]|nr:rna-directed dna polymerase from mobile element jockey-like [Pitangus sulphuratus]